MCLFRSRTFFFPHNEEDFVTEPSSLMYRIESWYFSRESESPQVKNVIPCILSSWKKASSNSIETEEVGSSKKTTLALDKRTRMNPILCCSPGDSFSAQRRSSSFVVSIKTSFTSILHPFVRTRFLSLSFTNCLLGILMLLLLVYPVRYSVSLPSSIIRLFSLPALTSIDCFLDGR